MTDTPATLLYALAFATIALGGWLWRSRRIALLEWAFIAASALATLSALKLLDLHLLLKPMPMAIAMVFVATRAMATGGITRNDALLLAAQLFSLGGDVFLMLPGDYFIPGLASFLVAHLFYIALFRQGQAWFPDRRALLAVLGVGAGMYVVIWDGLNAPVLKLAVAAYVGVISLMVAQAIGRATVLRDMAAKRVAWGACIFMLSDALIAISKFVTPVALSSLWILATYFAAQLLIMHHARSTGPTEPR